MVKKLKLTAQEILDKEFVVDFKGYSPEQVDSFLDMVLDDYQTVEENIQELTDKISQLEEEIKALKNANIELEGKQKYFDLSATTKYSSVDLLKRISRLEELIKEK